MPTSRKATRKAVEPVENHSEEVVQEVPSEEVLNEVDQVQDEAAAPIPGSPGATEAVLKSIADETAAMQDQVRYQMAQLLKLAQKTGTDLSEMFPTPPRSITATEEGEMAADYVAPVNRPRPGAPLGSAPNSGWVPWRMEDLDPTDTIEFVPQPVPSLVFPLTDEEGRLKIRLDVNDLVCWLTVGSPCTVNRIFYNAYMDSYNGWKELENFKRRGPAYAPWGDRGPDGRPTWHFESQALTFGLDPDGRYLTGGRQTMAEYEQSLKDGEDGGAPL